MRGAARSTKTVQSRVDKRAGKKINSMDRATGPSSFGALGSTPAWGTHAIPDVPRSPQSATRPLVDRFDRRIDHLRLSVTDACDLRCCYCRPRTDGAVRLPDHLSDDQRVEFVHFLRTRFGLAQVRLTGGEALIYDGLLGLVERLKERVPDVTLALTTNGRRLAAQAAALRRAGIDRLNVSLDSINEDTYHAMTGVDLRHVLAGLDAAARAGFPPPRINSVVLRAMNDSEVVSLARWAIRRGCELRFLEAMPIGPAAEVNRRGFVSADEIRTRLAAAFTLTRIPTEPGATATRFQAVAGDMRGVIGTIAPITEPFCGSCRRIRLTAQGLFFPCLLQPHHVDLRPAWRDNELDRTLIESMILSAVARKARQGNVQPTAMIQLGG